MKNVLLVFKNNIYRLKYNKAILAIIIIVTPLVVGLGIYFSTNTDIEGTIAITGATLDIQNSFEKNFKNEDNIKLEFLDDDIENTKLIRGEYIAHLNLRNNKIEINEFSNIEVKKALEAILAGESYENEASTESIIAKIVGFLIMFLFFGAISVADPFLSDRENKIYTRVLQGNVSYFEYVLGQFLYIISLLTVPVILTSYITINILNVDLGISMVNFIGIILLTGLLSGSFIILMSNLFKNRTAVGMNTSIISMITCLLSGCLINIDGDNKIIDGIRNLLPQKRLIDFANTFGMNDLVFVIGFIIIALIFSIYIGKKDFESGVFL